MMKTSCEPENNQRSRDSRAGDAKGISPPRRITAVPPPDHAARLRGAIAGLRGDREERETVDLTPKSAHEAITRQMVADLAADLAEVKTRVNAVLWLVAGAVIVDVTMRLAGVN
jgi:hypothetical protein